MCQTGSFSKNLILARFLMHPMFFDNCCGFRLFGDFMQTVSDRDYFRCVEGVIAEWVGIAVLALIQLVWLRIAGKLQWLTMRVTRPQSWTGLYCLCRSIFSAIFRCASQTKPNVSMPAQEEATPLIAVQASLKRRVGKTRLKCTPFKHLYEKHMGLRSLSWQ